MVKPEKREVHCFYKERIDNKVYGSEVASKYQKHFLRYRESLFIFLEQDGIPWHNNTAENAIRHLAVQRDISKGSARFLRRDSVSSIAYSEELISDTMSAPLQSTDRHYG